MGKLFKIIAGVLLIVVVIAIVLVITVKPEPTPPVDPKDNIGKHAYNKTSGAYQGQILDVKTCQTTSDVTCYLTDIPSFAKPREHPIDNVEVRDEAPIPRPTSSE